MDDTIGLFFNIIFFVLRSNEVLPRSVYPERFYLSSRQVEPAGIVGTR
jgi:hypothetical protein